MFDKRYIFDNGIDTLPFGHINIVHDRFFDEDENFDNEALSCWSSAEMYEVGNQREFETTVETNSNNAEIPDPGFVRTAANRESDIDSDEIADETDIEERAKNNPFIDCDRIRLLISKTKRYFQSNLTLYVFKSLIYNNSILYVVTYNFSLNQNDFAVFGHK